MNSSKQNRVNGFIPENISRQKHPIYVYLYFEVYETYNHKMNKNLHKAIILLIACIFTSCVTNKDLTYLQYKGVPSDTVISVTEQSAYLISYPVYSSGAIILPYVGKIQVAGKNLENITAVVKAALNSFITDAAVSVKLINNNVSLLGEVNGPGRYLNLIYKDRMNIFQALAMGSDLGDYSNRQQLQIIRQTAEAMLLKSSLLRTDQSYHQNSSM